MQPASDAEKDSQKANTTNLHSVPLAETKEPSSSENNSPAETTEQAITEAGENQKKATSTPAQPSISEEDRKALENLATAIGIPQLVTEIKKQREEINLIMTTLGGKPTAGGPPQIAPAGGAAAGFLKPILDKAPELIDGILKWVTQSGQPQQPTQISGIDKEIMEAAIKQTMEIKQKVAAANEALARIYMGGGSVMVDGNGNAVILKPKQKEEEKPK